MSCGSNIIIDIMWVITILSVILIYYFMQRRLNLKGPWGLPVLGNIYQLDPSAPHQTLSKWAEKYGGVYKITLFGSQKVIVNSSEAIREVLVTKSDDFADRPRPFRINFFYDPEIVFSSKSKEWSLWKKLTMMGLRMVGDGIERLERIAGDILEDMVSEMESYKGQPFNPEPLFHRAVCNINGTLIYGHKFEEDELRKVVELDRDASEVLTSSGNGIELDLLPVLRFLPNSAFKRLEMVKTKKDNFFEKLLGEIKIALQIDKTYQCVLTDLICYSQQNPDKKPIHVDVSTVVFLAANITTTIAIHAFVGIMASHRDMQVRCQEEVRKVIGSRTPSLSDRRSLPFVESMVLELLRYLSHTPLLIPHMTSKDTHVTDKFIPKGTEVWVNVWHLHHDEKLWDEPWTFQPDRFLDEQGNLLPPDHRLRKQLFVFGAGSRVCVGEALAKNRLFLFLATLLQKFTFYPEADGIKIPIDPRTYILGMSIWPKQFSVQAISNKP